MAVLGPSRTHCLEGPRLKGPQVFQMLGPHWAFLGAPHCFLDSQCGAGRQLGLFPWGQKRGGGGSLGDSISALA